MMKNLHRNKYLALLLALALLLTGCGAEEALPEEEETPWYSEEEETPPEEETSPEAGISPENGDAGAPGGENSENFSPET